MTSSVVVYENRENIDNYRNKNHNLEESEIEKGFDFTSYSGFQIKNLDILIDSFSIKLTKEEKEKIKKEILDFYNEKPNNTSYTFQRQLSYIKENKNYNCEFLCVLKKINDEKFDIKYGFKEISISNVKEVNDVNNQGNELNCLKKLLDKFVSCIYI